MPLRFRLFILSIIILAVASSDAADLRVLTFNIRYSNPKDGANGWLNRRDAAAKLIAEEADIAGLQEVLPAQRQDLVERLTDFSYVGLGREAEDRGEGAPIFYRKARFNALASGTFWLAETPETPGSKAWGANLPRVCTWVRLRDSTGGSTIYVFNTHLDHQSQEARAKSIPLIRSRMEARKSKDPALLTGDFNMHPGNEAFNEIGLDSTYQSLGVTPEGTFHGFSDHLQPGPIDFIFTEKNRWRVTTCSVLKTQYLSTDGTQRYVSDHFPVAAVLALAPMDH